VSLRAEHGRPEYVFRVYEYVRRRPEERVSVRHNLLAILSLGPCYGYQLRTEYERRTGGARTLNVGQIYNTLDRLERDGLVQRAHTDDQGHVYYQVTDDGRVTAERWLHEGVPATFDEAIERLAMASTIAGADAAHLLRRHRAAATDHLRGLSAHPASPPSSGEELAAAIALEARIAGAEAELRWLDRAEALLSRAAHDGVTRELPLSTDVPKRGRPARLTS
jgi:DNA-binding PadR family transcriptional regulator